MSCYLASLQQNQEGQKIHNLGPPNSSEPAPDLAQPLQNIILPPGGSLRKTLHRLQEWLVCVPLPVLALSSWRIKGLRVTIPDPRGRKSLLERKSWIKEVYTHKHTLLLQCLVKPCEHKTVSCAVVVILVAILPKISATCSGRLRTCSPYDQHHQRGYIRTTS